MDGALHRGFLWQMRIVEVNAEVGPSRLGSTEIVICTVYQLCAPRKELG
jgi:hypothetical protein